MAPFVRSGSAVRDSLKTIVALKRGCYDVNANQAIDKMSERIAQRSPMIALGVNRQTTLYDIRKKMGASQTRILNLAKKIEDDLADADDCSEAMSYLAYCTKLKLICTAVITATFSGLGLVGLMAKRKFAMTVAFIAAGVTILSLMDDLEMRSVELNSQFDYLREICNEAAHSLIDLALYSTGHNFLFSVMKERFGESLTDRNPDVDDLLETYCDDY